MSYLLIEVDRISRATRLLDWCESWEEIDEKLGDWIRHSSPDQGAVVLKAEDVFALPT